ncbi:MAG: TonB-dependent receptor [bacterium]
MSNRTKYLLSLTLPFMSFGMASAAMAQSQDDVEEDLIIVTGSPLQHKEDEILTGASILTDEELSMRQAGSLGETLKSTPGLTSTFFGPGASRPVIRGQGGARIRILTNGIGSIDAAASSPDHAVAAEPAMAERIEVIKGSSLLRFGSAATNGVINVIDGRIPKEMPSENYEGVVRLGTASVDNAKDLAIGSNIALGNSFALHIEGARRETDDYDVPGYAIDPALNGGTPVGVEGTVANSFTKNSSYALGGTKFFDRGFFGLSAKHMNAKYGVPGEEPGSPEAGVFIKLDQNRLDMNSEFELDTNWFEKITMVGGLADYEHTEFESPTEPGTVFTNEGGEIRVELIQQKRGPWHGAFGLQHSWRDFAAIGDEAFIPPTTTAQTGVYSFQDLDRDNWHFEAAARLETTEHKSDTTQEKRDFQTFSASAGASYDFGNGLKIGTNYSRTERAPTSDELFANGPHLATGQFFIGDTNLKDEIAHNLETSLYLENAWLSLKANLFHTSYDDYIFASATGAQQDGLPVYQNRAEKAKFTGAEISADAPIGEVGPFALDGDIAAQYVTAELDVVGNDNLPLMPPLSVIAGVNAEADGYGGRVEIDYHHKQDKTALFELPSDQYTMVNAFAHFQPLPEHDNVTLQLSALNLTDEEARQHSSPLKDRILLPGRNFKISLETKF